MNTRRFKLNTLKNSLLWNEKDVWFVKGTESGKIHAGFRIKITAINTKAKLEKQYLEKCEIIFIEKEVKK